MRFEVDGSSVVKLDGELTHAHSKMFINRVDELLHSRQFGNVLLVDCTDLKHLDGSGLGALTTILLKLRAHNQGIRLINTQGQPNQIITNLKIGKHLLDRRKKCRHQ